MEIKLPIKWLNEKGVAMVIGDVCNHSILGVCSSWDSEDASHVGAIMKANVWDVTSFNWRRGIIKDFSIPIMAHVHEAKWKPNAEVLMEMYTEEQSAKLTEPKKETKLRLTIDDVGKKFENEAFAVFEVTGVGTFSASLKTTSALESVWTCELDGSIHNAGKYKDNKLVKRHEPRWWLKDMPDADSFSKDVSSIHFEGDMNWYVTDVNGHDHWLPYADLPKLDDNDRKLSEMTIEYLRVWQKKNK